MEEELKVTPSNAVIGAVEIMPSKVEATPSNGFALDNTLAEFEKLCSSGTYNLKAKLKVDAGWRFSRFMNNLTKEMKSLCSLLTI